MSEPTIPTEEEISQLPRWAKVAFAGRCARRVFALYRHFWSGAPAEHTAIVQQAVEITERSATTAYADTAACISCAADLERIGGLEILFTVAADAVRTAAAKLPATASKLASTTAAKAAEIASTYLYREDSLRTRRSIRTDFDALKNAAEKELWVDGTAVASIVFTKLWPDGPPPHWPLTSRKTFAVPSEPTIPTEEEIAKLPRWARVSFAARCARRVLPRVEHLWGDHPKQHLAALARAVRVTEEVAAHANDSEYVDARSDPCNPAHIAASAVVLSAAYPAAAVIALAASFTRSTSVAAATEMTFRALPVPQVRQAIRADFDALTIAAAKNGWTDSTPVAPEFFGQMWPEGIPQGWLAHDRAASAVTPADLEISSAEIAQLPHWAKVAFAARCARRVLPLYCYFYPDAPAEHVSNVTRAIETAERIAATTRISEDARAVADRARGARFATTGNAADVAATANAATDAIYDVNAVFFAVGRAARAGGSTFALLPAIRADFNFLTRTAVEQSWTNDTPVSPNSFGPLWPKGAPPGWPAVSESAALSPFLN